MKERIDLDDPDYSYDQSQTVSYTNPGSVVVDNKNVGKTVTILCMVIVAIIFCACAFYWLFPSYYVAKLPDISAGTVKVDGYMHEDKSCCQKVADAVGASVIRVRPTDKAGTNEYGQIVKYEDTFSYCPLCCN